MYRKLAGIPTGLGSWRPRPGMAGPSRGPTAYREALQRLADPILVVDVEGAPGIATQGDARLGRRPAKGEHRLLGHVPALLPDDLGDPAFRAAHGTRFAYIAGEMANGIASVEMVEAMAHAGMLGFFGAAGLLPRQVEAALERLKKLGQLPWGANLIHSPDDPALEAAIVDLYLRQGLRLVGASAYLDLTLPVVRYRVTGIHRAKDGSVLAPNRIIAKVSRAEVARKFLSPPPEHFLRMLVERGEISAEQMEMAKTIPMAEDVTAEADSGGHTDNRPLVVVLPAIQALRDELHERFRYAVRPRVGAAGGIATPASTAAAFSMGAAYVMTGSVNQACLEAGTSDLVREMLAGAASTDVAMAAAADMFEMGVKLQVLSKGTLFPVRAARLYDLYRSYDSLEAIPASIRTELEEKIFRTSLEEAWEGCKTFFAERDPRQVERAEKDPKHRMALVFRSYLGRSSIWANQGVAERRIDFQIWCGPAMGAFNGWTKGSFLEDWRERRVVTVARNLLHGAASLTRVAALRSQGVALPEAAETFPPRRDEELDALLIPSPREPDTESETCPSGTGPSSAENHRHEPIAIVGMAALFPKAADLQGYWRLLLQGEDAVGEIPKSHFTLADYHDPDPSSPDKTYATRGAFLDPVDFDPTEFGIPPSILEATDTSQLLALLVAKRALQDAGYGDDVSWDRGRASVLLGVTGTQELVISLGARLGHPHWRKALHDAGVDPELSEEVVERIGRAYVEWQENSFPGLLGNVVAGRIANRLDLGGTNNVVDAACASSLAAVHMACMELWTGASDLVISGGVDALSDIFMHMCFSKTPALSPSGDARPFSSKADGIVLGEGVGMVVLRRLSDAERDGDRIHAVIRGMGTSSDGKAKSIYAPLPSGQARALRAAYREAGISPKTIDLVEGHGTGTAAGDAGEVEALAEVYREAIPQGAPVALGSVKSQIGHTKAAAGAAGLIKAALALEHKVLPPTLKVDAPHPKLAGSPFHLPTEALPWLRKGDHPRRAAVSAFGFGGSNFHVVLEEYETERRTPAWDGSVQIFAGSADDEAGLERWLGELAKAKDLAAFASKSRASFRASSSHRLLLVVEKGDDLGRLITQAQRRIAEGPPEEGKSQRAIHYGVGPIPGKVAFLFPGQGSQSVGMLRDLATVFPEMLSSLEKAPRIAGLIYPPASFDAEEVRARRVKLTRTDKAQPALGLVERGALEILRRFGVEAELFAGHSYGELVALHAAGRFDEETLLRISQVRGERMAGNGSDRGTMLAVHAPLEEIETLLEEEGLPLILANRNAPAQGVLSGDRESIEKAKEACAKRGLHASPLQVGAAFHSPMVAAAAESFLQDLEAFFFAPGKGTVIGNTEAEPYPADEAEAKRLLASQLALPVHFVETVERLWDEGARAFVEVGPRAALTGLVRSILPDRRCLAVAVDASAGRRSGLSDLATVLSALAAFGHPVALEEWERPRAPVRGNPVQREPRMAIPLSGANHRAPRKEIPPRPRQASQATSATSHPTLPPVPAESTMKKIPPNPEATSLVLEALRANGDTLRALQILQEQTALAHHRFLETQGLAQASFHQLLLGQQRLMEQATGTPGSIPSAFPETQPGFPSLPAPSQLPALQPFAAAPPAMAPFSPAPGQQMPTVVPQAPPAQPEAIPPATPAAYNRAVAPAPSAPPAAEVDIVGSVLEVVAESTGYPKEMLDLDMDLESDLGIDSIKRVEILSLLAKQIPNAPRVEPEQLGGLRTLRQVAEMFGTSPAAAAEVEVETEAPLPPEPAAKHVSLSPGEGKQEDTVLGVVAELTGYPREMLDLDMDLEADLGIDSIKRVEILSVLSQRIPGAPHVEPEKLGDLRTLRHMLHLVAGRERAPSSPRKSKEGAAEDAAEPHSRSLPSYEVLATRLPAGEAQPLPQGEIWITEDDVGLAEALAAVFRKQGKVARVVSLDTPPAETQIGALLLLGTGDEGQLADGFGRLRSLAGPLRRSGSLIATVSRRDGAFGRIEPRLGVPLQGGLAGLVKTIPFEWPEVAVRALDVSAHLPAAEAAASVAAELLLSGPVEVGLGPAGRMGLTLEPSSPTPGGPTLEKGDLVVVSGGARGVTAACIIELAKRSQPSFLLLGRSALREEGEPSWLSGAEGEAELRRALLEHGFPGERPTPRQLGDASREILAQREIRDTLAKLRAAGSEAMYQAVDVRDPGQVREAVEKARLLFGEVRGLVHGAGVLRDKRIEDKTDDDFDQVVGTKLDGFRSLLDAAEGDDLRSLALFTSVSGRFGRRGQADYAMANEALVALAHHEASKRPACNVIAFDWGPWAGGMVNAALAKEFEKEGISLVALDAGAHFFADAVLSAGGGSIEWVVGSGWPAPASPEHPWSAVSLHSISLSSHRFLGDHRLGGRAVLPVAMMVEYFARSAPTQGASVEDFRLLKGVVLGEEAQVDLTVWRRPAGPGAYEVELRGKDDRVHARARLGHTGPSLGSGVRPLVEWDTLPPFERAAKAIYAEGDLFHGPLFHAIESVEGLGKGGIRLSLRTSPIRSHWVQGEGDIPFASDPLLLDGVFQGMVLWCREHYGVPSLPSRLGAWRSFVKEFPPRVFARIGILEASETTATADCEIVDETGKLLAVLEGYVCTSSPTLEAAFRGAA